MANKSFYLDSTVEIEFRGRKVRIYKGDLELFEKIKARDEQAKKPEKAEKVEKPKVKAEKPKEQNDN